MTGPLPVHRSERAASGRGTLATPRSSSSPASTDSSDQQNQIAAQHEAFDFGAAERAEILREPRGLADHAAGPSRERRFT